MTNNNVDISQWDKDDDGIDDKTEEDIAPTMSADYEIPELEEVPKKTFWDTAFGRTIRLKNKTGKIGATVLGGVGSTFIPGPMGDWINKGFQALITTQTGVGMEFLADMSLLQLIIMAVAVLITVVVPMVFPKVRDKKAWEIIDSRVDDVADEVVAAVDKDSEGGKSITRNEWRSIISGAIKKDDEQ
ncbi:hypothetical protein [Fodinibius sp. SL11]|uniref:hypothetical protein n=1 Tax=Fodinibius sp. SL11 TaxID=3425690 RepID=UPI003F882133